MRTSIEACFKLAQYTGPLIIALGALNVECVVTDSR